MREVVTIGVGKCGINMTHKFLDSVREDHDVDQQGAYKGQADQLGKGIKVHFNESSKNKYIPRSIIVDTDPMQIDKAQSGPLGQLFSPDSFIKG
jgi:tubulin beta